MAPTSTTGPQTLVRNVLVALDARGQAENALAAAQWLAKATSARLSFVHAVGSALADWTWTDDPRAASRAEGLVDRAWRSTVRQVESTLGPRLPDGRPVPDAVIVRTGPPADVVLEEARRAHADVIVLGYDLERPRLDFGGTARRIIAGAPGSVWVQKHVPRAIERILVPVDLSKDSLNALTVARELARATKCRLEVLHAFARTNFLVSTWPDYPDMNTIEAIDEIRDGQRAEFARVMAAFDWGGVDHATRFLEGDPTRSILDAQREADLIVLGSHGRSRTFSILLGSVAWSVLRKADLPVLAVRHPERVLGGNGPGVSEG